jgi:hypothetical protein
MQAHGVTIETLRGLVRAGLATADRGPAHFNSRAIVTMLEITDATSSQHRDTGHDLQLAEEHRLPTINGYRELAAAGGLMSLWFQLSRSVSRSCVLR